jgi:hypothetical protein
VYQITFTTQKCWITVSSQATPQVWVPQMELATLPFWHLEFGGSSYIFGKLVDLCIRPDLKKQKYYETSTTQRLLHIKAAEAANVVDHFPTL